MSRSSLGLCMLALLGLGGLAPAQTVIFTENFETGGLGSYTETDISGAPAATLWHGEGDCGPPFVPPGPPTDLLFTPSAGSYTVTNTTPSFNSIAGVPGAIPIIPAGNDDITTGPIPRFMPFSFFGVPKTWVQINTNGFVAFDQTIGSGFFTNAPIPTAASPNDMAAPWWDDLHTGAGGTVWMLISFGSQVIVEWNGMEHFPSNGSGENATFQLKLNPSPANTIEFHYSHTTFASGGDPWNATVGLEDSTGTAGIDPTPNTNMNTLFPNIGGTPVPDLIPASMGTNAAAYNRGDIGIFNFDTGAVNDGAIESPLITPTAGEPRIAFVYTKETEGGGSGSFDQCFVETKPVGGAWSPVTQIIGNVACNAPTAVTALCVGNVNPGVSFQHRFYFDTVDTVGNNYLGWYVDNVVVTEVGGTGTFSPLLAENFEGMGLGVFVETDINGTPAATLWHGEQSCDIGVALPAVMQTKAAAYNQGDIGLYNFDTGAANEGAIESPTLATGPPTTALRLQFDYAKETEQSLSFDQCFVEVSPGGGGWTTVTQLPAANVICGSAPSHVLLGGACDPALNALLAAGGGKFRFFFDSVDSVGNTGRGWYVDNVLFEGAAPGGTIPYGAGCPGSGGTIPAIGSTGQPQVGNFGFAVNLSSALPGTAVLLVIGVSDQTWLGFTLPLNLAFLGAPACSLLASADILFTNATSAGGTSSQLLPIPNLPSLVGTTLFAQWKVIDPGAVGPLPIAGTRGLRIIVF